MHVQVLSSGSGGNCTLLRAGECSAVIDAGLPMRDLRGRLEAAGAPFGAPDHVLLTHGHLDHARSAGALARRRDAELHCSERLMGQRAVARARRLHALRFGRPTPLEGASGAPLDYTAVEIPHDARPTVAFRVRHGERVLVQLTDMGAPCPRAAGALRGAHLLVLEFNHDRRMLLEGAYPEPLKRRVGGDLGHLSNEQAGEMLERLAGPELHTLVLAHLSAHNNTPERALEHAQAVLARLGLAHVRVLVASQDEVGPRLEV